MADGFGGDGAERTARTVLQLQSFAEDPDVSTVEVAPGTYDLGEIGGPVHPTSHTTISAVPGTAKIIAATDEYAFTQTDGGEHIRWEGLEIEGSPSDIDSNGYSGAIYTRGVDYAEAVNCHVYNWSRNGIWFRASDTAGDVTRGCRVSGCHVHDLSALGINIEGVGVDGEMADLRISDSYVHHIPGSTPETSDSGTQTGIGAEAARGGTVSGCVTWQTGQEGIRADDSVSIVANTVIDPAQRTDNNRAGIAATAGAQRATITGNCVRLETDPGTDDDGILAVPGPNAGENIAISGNTVMGPFYRGISVNRPSVAVVGNSVDGAYSGVVVWGELEDVTGVSVGHNTLSDGSRGVVVRDANYSVDEVALVGNAITAMDQGIRERATGEAAVEAAQNVMVSVTTNYDDTGALVINGGAYESAAAETPQGDYPPGTIVRFEDSDGGSGTGTYLTAKDGSFVQLASSI
ncbi:right-handed parallel beta-helix repeat-containing protein [Halosimplex marinum]|uniref:right-handed parallel beta-helix repeat-containing protein n=1 Tax=Halosimplex marinum TaxID=3396620 RepID=UPI003F572DAC